VTKKKGTGSWREPAPEIENAVSEHLNNSLPAHAQAASAPQQGLVLYDQANPVEGTELTPAGTDARFSLLKRQPGSQIFTKFADVKSRIIWTPERRKLLQEMWERGEKAPTIAAALGCKAGAVNVARARFGLKPRRIVSGRPKQEPDEPAHKIERVAFTTSRLMEFCTEKELVAQTGHESYEWPRVIIKELVDNAIDAAEEAEVAPTIKVAITTGKRGKPTLIVVEDNGPGIAPDTITGIIDYDVRVSSREAYISPTRGRQGNALKTILPMSMCSAAKSRARLGSRRTASSIASILRLIRSSSSRSLRTFGPAPRSRPAPASPASGRTGSILMRLRHC
jgi:hypothetical protein